MPVFSLTTNDTAFSNIKNALFVKAEFKGTADNVSSYVDFGPLKEGTEISITPLNTKLEGLREFATLYKFEAKLVVLCSGTAMVTAINAMLGNAVDTRLTDINGAKYTVTSTQAIPSPGMEIKGGNAGDAIQFPITVSGTLTPTALASAIS